jgi:hypothetical protein
MGLYMPKGNDIADFTDANIIIQKAGLKIEYLRYIMHVYLAWHRHGLVSRIEHVYTWVINLKIFPGSIDYVQSWQAQ